MVRRGAETDPQWTTYTYVDFDTTQITDPAGNLTTLIHDGTYQRNIAAMIDPLGHGTSWTWQDGMLASEQDPLGNLTTYSYGTSSDGYPILQSIQRPAGIFSYVYDANNNVQATIDALGRTPPTCGTATVE